MVSAGITRVSIFSQLPSAHTCRFPFGTLPGLRDVKPPGSAVSRTFLRFSFISSVNKVVFVIQQKNLWAEPPRPARQDGTAFAPGKTRLPQLRKIRRTSEDPLLTRELTERLSFLKKSYGGVPAERTAGDDGREETVKGKERAADKRKGEL